jgi:GDP-4-dehydro-6-deoxy-D-mannose reductase
LEAVRTQSPKTRVILISSAEIYGHVRPEHLPIKETQPFAPANIVGSTKAAMELAIHPYTETYDLDVVIARPFNHTGPRQVPDFVCSTFAEQIALIEQGAEPIIRVGNLTPKRDFADVRDIVRGYRCLAFSGQHGQAYNLASGNSFGIRDVLDMLVSMARVKVEVVQDPDRMRQVQVMDVRGDISKVKAACGWEPRIPLEKSLRDLLNWHRNELRSKTPSKHEGGGS